MMAALLPEPALLSAGPLGYLISSFKLSYPQCPILQGSPFSWSPSSHCNMCTFAGVHPGPFLLLTALQVSGSCFMNRNSFKNTYFFFLSFHHPFVASFFEVKPVAQDISKLVITRDGLKLLILLPLSVSSVHHHTWSLSCSLKSL